MVSAGRCQDLVGTDPSGEVGRDDPGPLGEPEHGGGHRVGAVAALPPAPPALDGGCHNVPPVDRQRRVRRDLVQRVPLGSCRLPGGRGVGERFPGGGRRGREHRVVGNGERYLEREGQEVECQPEICDRLGRKQGDGPGGATPPGDRVRGRQGAYQGGVVREAGRPSGAGLPQRAQLVRRRDAVQLGAEAAVPGGHVFRRPVDLEPCEGDVQGGGDLRLRLASGCPDLGVEVPRYEVQAWGQFFRRNGVADPGGNG